MDREISMSAWHGSYEPQSGAVYAGNNRYRNKGVARLMRAQKRMEAEARNRLTEHGNTRAHREGRCDRSCSGKYV